MTLSFEDANSKLVGVVTIADVDAEKHDFDVEVQEEFWRWSLVSILLLMFGLGYIKLNLGRDSDARFGQDFEV